MGIVPRQTGCYVGLDNKPLGALTGKQFDGRHRPATVINRFNERLEQQINKLLLACGSGNVLG